MEGYVSSIVRKLRPYFDGLLREDPATGSLFLYDDELGDRASCCTTGEVACFYVLDDRLHGGSGAEIAKRLAEDVRSRQLASGAFEQPYYVKKGELPTIDIAEIGAVANSLYHIYRQTGSEPAKAALLDSARYLLTQVAKENPGAVYKNPKAKEHDVLNGDVYAAHTWGRAFQLELESVFRDKARAVIEHIMNRFGRHAPGWWPYTERWDGSVGMGNSVAYQGTIVAFAHTVLPLLPPSLRRQWEITANAAVDTMLSAMKAGPNDDNEAPWWSRDWNNAWEIYLAFSRFPERNDTATKTAEVLLGVDRRLDEQGIERFRPAVRHADPERTPVTTTFRKAATFAGIFSYMILDAGNDG